MSFMVNDSAITIKEEGGKHTDPQDKMKIYLKVMKTVPLKIKSSETVGQLKTKYQNMEGVAPHLQKLFFSGNHLQDDKVLADYRISGGSTLNLYLSSELGIQIFIELPTGQRFPLTVKCSDSIRSIKGIIQEKESIPAEQQALVFDGRTLEDDHLLQAYSIPTNSTVHLLLQKNEKMQILVQMKEGEVLTFNVRPYYTVCDIKTMIKSKRQIPQEDQKLMYDGKQLKDSRMLASYKIEDKSILHLSYPMKVFINEPTGTIIWLDVHHTDTVSDVMKRIKKTLYIDVDEFRLVLCGEMMRAD